jgi:radical SAM-linked protein
VQRLRITFSRGEEIKYLSHLDIMRLWERALRRADIPLAYSQGYNPHPKISIASPLPIGVTGDGELMDIFLRKTISPYFLMKAVSEQMPAGVSIVGIDQVSTRLPSLQSQVRQAEYVVQIATDRQRTDVERAIDSFMENDHFPWQHRRDGEVRQYDLRAVVDGLWLIDWHDSECAVGMCLRTGSEATGRAEQVTKALGFTDRPSSIRRTRLILAG